MLPQTVYVEDLGSSLNVATDVTRLHSSLRGDTVKTVGVYSLTRTVNITLGAVAAEPVTDLPVDPRYPETLYLRENGFSGFMINRTPQGAAMRRGGDGKVGVYTRTSFAKIGPQATLTDVAVANAAIPTTNQG